MNGQSPHRPELEGAVRNALALRGGHVQVTPTPWDQLFATGVSAELRRRSLHSGPMATAVAQALRVRAEATTLQPPPFHSVVSQPSPAPAVPPPATSLPVTMPIAPVPPPATPASGAPDAPTPKRWPLAVGALAVLAVVGAIVYAFSSGSPDGDSVPATGRPQAVPTTAAPTTETPTTATPTTETPATDPAVRPAEPEPDGQPALPTVDPDQPVTPTPATRPPPPGAPATAGPASEAPPSPTPTETPATDPVERPPFEPEPDGRPALPTPGSEPLDTQRGDLDRTDE